MASPKLPFDITLASEVFDAAINEDLWPELIDRLTFGVGAMSGVIFSVNRAKGGSFEGLWHSPNWNTEMKNYNEEFSKLEATGVPIMLASDQYQVLTEYDLWPDEPNLHKRKDFVHFNETMGFNHRIAAKLSEDPLWFNTFAVQFDKRRGQADVNERAVFSAYLPFISQAVRLSNVFQSLKSRFKAVLSVLDKYMVPVCVVDARGQVVVSNQSADVIIRKENGVRISRENRLELLDSDSDARLMSAIANAAATAKGDADATAITISCPRLSGGDPFSIEVSPLRDADREIDASFRGAIVKIYDPTYTPIISIDGFASVFGLTPTEMEVARLIVQGASTEDIADIRSVSVATVRTQIKFILQKTNSHNRTDLVRKALSAHLPIDTGENSEAG